MITIDLGSTIITYAILGLLAYIGWQKGFRYMLSLALFITLGYMLTIQGGNFVVGFINRVFSNAPKLVAFAVGRDPATAEPLGQLIPDNIESPLVLRVLVFIALLVVGYIYAWPWEGTPLKVGDKSAQPMRVLGLVAGLYTGLLLISATAIFWGQTDGTLTLTEGVVRFLNGLPTFAAIIPSIIVAFFILLFTLIILRFNRIWMPDPPPSGGGPRH